MKKLSSLLAVTILAPSSALAQTICSNMNIAGTYVTHNINPRQTDPRITGKNNPKFGVISTNGAWRNQLVVFFPGTGGVPATFNNFCQNAANLGFYALALTYENDISLANGCGNDPDPDCHYKWRWAAACADHTTRHNRIAHNATAIGAASEGSTAKSPTPPAR